MRAGGKPEKERKRKCRHPPSATLLAERGLRRGCGVVERPQVWQSGPGPERLCHHSEVIHLCPPVSPVALMEASLPHPSAVRLKRCQEGAGTWTVKTAAISVCVQSGSLLLSALCVRVSVPFIAERALCQAHTQGLTCPLGTREHVLPRTTNAKGHPAGLLALIAPPLASRG